MTKFGATLRDWENGRLDSRSLYRFIKHLGPDSAFFKASRPDDVGTVAWLDGSAECALLAELIDAVRHGTNALMYKGTGRRPPRIEPYERPWLKSHTTRYGSKPVKIKEFNQWYYGGDARCPKSESRM